MPDRALEAAALAAIDARAIAADVSELVRVPSVTGAERPALERLAQLAERRGLEAELVEHDLEALRAHPGHPGEEAPRDELAGLTITLPAAARDAPRLCFNGHLDVVAPGPSGWRRDPWSGAVADGWVHGRGAADMKGAVVAALHAVAAVRAVAGAAPAELVLQAVASEEDGGLGTFAALERDAAFDAALIPEPTAFGIACSQAGALTFRGVVAGVSAHAALRLRGASAIDRYVAVHAALHEVERRLNADVRDPLMRALELPYPVSVGRLEAGRWSSEVPDRLVFEGRAGVPVETAVGDLRELVETALRAACRELELEWSGGQFAPATTAPEHPFVALARAATAAERGAQPPLIGVPYGSDMRHFCARGIPCVMLGASGLELAHAVDERVRVDELAALARILVRVALQFGEGPALGLAATAPR